MPATREDIADAVLHGKIPGLRSLVICLEDAVSEADIPVALKNLEHLLHELSNSMSSLGKNDWPLVFIRPRHAEMGRWLKAHYDLSAVDGFVLPKFTLSSLAEWWDIMVGTHLCMMPTLETKMSLTWFRCASWLPVWRNIPATTALLRFESAATIL